MNWDDIRYVLALARHGSLARASKELGVDHTTVGRRLAAAEEALSARLFARTPSGYVLTAEGEALLEPMRRVEDAVHGVERDAASQHTEIEGTVRVTSPETFGVAYLAPRLATLGRRYPKLVLELLPGGKVLDLARREAEVAVRFFRSREAGLTVRRVGDFAHALYSSREYLAKRPLRRPNELAHHALLLPTGGPKSVELAWLRRLAPDARPSFASELTLGLVGAARAHLGIALLPRYVGDAEPGLERVPMPHEPTEPIWLTVHADTKTSPRVRAVLDFLAATLAHDRALLRGS